MRSYHVAAVSLAIGCDHKWLDNVITQYSPAGVTRSQRGVARRVSVDGALVIAVARRLSVDLGTPMTRALALSEQLVESGGRLACGGGTELALDIEAVRGSIERRLGDAAEVLVTPRRGRPPRGRGRADER